MRLLIPLTMGLLAALCCLLAGPEPAAAQVQTGAGKRVALVIGNAKYGHIPTLPNVANDAKAMAVLFEAAKFDSVVLLYDQRAADLKRALRDLADRAAGADVAVLFYAGHGIEVDRVNYLIPVDARLKSDLDVEDETVSLDRVLQLLEGARLRVVLLDACRENPFAKSMKLTAATRSVGRGLGRIEAGGANTLIAFATEPYGVADDGTGHNSPFTTALLKHLGTPGLDVRLALGSVRDEVMASTAGKQKPYVTSSLGGGVIAIVPGTPGALPPVPKIAPSQAEVAQFCQSVAGNPSLAVVEALLAANRGTPMAPCIESRIAELRKPASTTLPPPPLSPSRTATPLTADEERALRPKDSFKECDTCPEMVVMPTGRFLMGSSPAEIAALKKKYPALADTYGEEGPQHEVTIARSFAIGKFAVTFAEWDACVATLGCTHRPNDHGWGRGKRPVIQVSWDDITQQYLPWLKRVTGKGYRLPAEAEREYAARAGTATEFWWGSSISTSQANYDGRSTYGGGRKGEFRRKTVVVDSFAPNPWGLFSVHGNIWEWVQDCYHDAYNGAPSDGSAWTFADCPSRVLRGGAWGTLPGGLRSAARLSSEPFVRDDYYFGFRVVRAVAGP